MVEPGDVRLIPNINNDYAWQVLPEKQYLFQKHISKHSIGAYCELCRGIGVSFEAVRPSEKRQLEEMDLPEEKPPVLASGRSDGQYTFPKGAGLCISRVWGSIAVGYLSLYISHIGEGERR